MNFGDLIAPMIAVPVLALGIYKFFRCLAKPADANGVSESLLLIILCAIALK